MDGRASSDAPAPLDSRSALLMSGINRSDDLFLFMFYKGALVGLTPGARYAAAVGVEIATDTPFGLLWRRRLAGRGRPDQDRATAEEPVPVRDGDYPFP